ncbi:hypothetical protein Runsl_2549 [Runella slithyformis DSM 19594]|uniref:Uncharacterized protein n=1 Tax=Runella slithyformis (strain ATCC 29530 / DSM 19594 / LMG 11500 / NCIMB 11436 / LSU 4) TaxID=761193 RepID=A0A7U3ZKK8_RUNSL|nr:hypothetical protein Runsl_2549 [Runella slithyformis DSM 19594]
MYKKGPPIETDGPFCHGINSLLFDIVRYIGGFPEHINDQ